MTLKIILKGGEGSGHKGHAGRPGSVGGSVAGSVAMSLRTGKAASRTKLSSMTISRSGGSKDMQAEVELWGGDRGHYAGMTVYMMSRGFDGLVFRKDGEIIAVATLKKRSSSVIELAGFGTKMPGVGRSAMTRIAQEAVSANSSLVVESTGRAAGFYRTLGLVEKGGIHRFVWDVNVMKEVLESQQKDIIDGEPNDGIYTILPIAFRNGDV